MSFWIFFASFYSSVFTGSFLWMMLNGGLILTSYLTDNMITKIIDEIDYFCILMISLCYLNDVYTNVILLIAASYEYYSKNTFDTIKNVSCGIALIKCCISCYKIDIFICINLVWFTVIGVHVYRARKVYYEKHKNHCDNLFYSFMTMIWRLCALVMLMSASYTMEKSRNALFKF